MSEEHFIQMSRDLGELTGTIKTHIEAQGKLNENVVKMLQRHEDRDDVEHGKIHKRISGVKRLSLLSLFTASGGAAGATAASQGWWSKIAGWL